MKEALNVMVVGSGGREHALGWKVRQNPYVNELFFAPGNAGTQELGLNVAISSDDINELASFASKKKVNLTIVGPEGPLEKGIVNHFESRGLRIFGPTSEEARLETSKAWATQFMRRHKIPHPETQIVTSIEDAENQIKNFGEVPVVVKASGLASGKGVIVPSSFEEAMKAPQQLRDELGDAASKILIQERLFGQEISLMAISDGREIVPFIPAQDYKRLRDGDRGPNTGGMGAYAPMNINRELMRKIHDKILNPTIWGMAIDGIPFKGILYAGIMVSGGDPYVLEYNVRMGDPETQPLMMLMESDLVNLIEASIDETLNARQLSFRDGGAVSVVLASEGYPENSKIGRKVLGLESNHSDKIQVFHAGTEMKKGEVVTLGGRVLSVTAVSESISSARLNAYSRIGKDAIHIQGGMQVRSDIAESI